MTTTWKQVNCTVIYFREVEGGEGGMGTARLQSQIQKFEMVRVLMNLMMVGGGGGGGGGLHGSGDVSFPMSPSKPFC